MIDEEQVKSIVKEVLDEEHLTNFIKIFEKEHNLFRGSHDKIGLPEAIEIHQTIINHIVEKFEDEAITTDKIADGAIVNKKLYDECVDASKIAEDAVEEAKIAADAVTAAKIAVAGLDGETGDVAADHIVANMLQTGCVVTEKLYANAVTAPKINVVGLDGETGRICVVDAVDADEITAGINAHALTLIEAGKVLISGETDLSDWRHGVDATLIDGGKIYTQSITAAQILAGTISADKINVGDFIYLPSDEDLVGYWSLDEGSEALAVDGSGKGNDGTLYPTPVPISPCDAVTDWTGTALTIDTADKKEGVGSLKDDVAVPVIDTVYDTTYNPTGTWDWSAKKHILFWLKCDRASTVFTRAKLRISDTLGNWREWTLTFSAGEWITFKFLLSTGTGETGTPPNLALINQVQIFFETADTTPFYKKIDDLRVDDRPQWVDGKVGKCLEFDGVDDYVDLTGVVNAGTTHTITLWVYSRDSTTANKFLLDIQTGRIVLGWGANTPGKIGVYDGAWKEFGNSPSVDTWHHVAFVLNSATSKMKMYLDGSQYGSELDYTPRSIGEAVTIGSRHTGTQYFFNGIIDEVRIYDLALTEGEIKALYLYPAGNKYRVISGVQIADDTITAAKIVAGTITADEIAALAITTDKLDALAVTAEKIAAGAITTDKLDALAVTADKIAANTITADQIAAGTITADEILAGTITVDELIFNQRMYWHSMPSVQVRNSNNTEQTTLNTIYEKIKETKLNEDTGKLRIYFQLKTNDASNEAFARIYKNGVALGTEQSTVSESYVAFSQDLGPFSKDDLLQIYAHRASGGAGVTYVQNFQLLYDRAVSTLAGVDLATPLPTAAADHEDYSVTNQDP